MNLHRITNAIAAENTYILENDSHLILVDPGSDWNVIEASIRELNKPIAAILLTHTHYESPHPLRRAVQRCKAPALPLAAQASRFMHRPAASGMMRNGSLHQKGKKWTKRW